MSAALLYRDVGSIRCDLHDSSIRCFSCCVGAEGPAGMLLLALFNGYQNSSLYVHVSKLQPIEEKEKVSRHVGFAQQVWGHGDNSVSL